MMTHVANEISFLLQAHQVFRVNNGHDVWLTEEVLVLTTGFSPKAYESHDQRRTEE